MPDDRPDERDPEVAARLAVEPLDEVTRRRLVTTALAAADNADAHPTRRTDTAATDGRRLHAWRWVAAAAAVVIVAVGGLAIVTAEGGHDEQQAATPVQTPERAADAAGSAGSAALASAGDFGDLDVAANLAALRAALRASPTKTSTPEQSPSAAAEAAPASRAACAEGLPAGTVLAQGTGTLDGRATTVVLTRLADGSRSFDALLADPCEVRHLR
jgi:hypothetical protein